MTDNTSREWAFQRARELPCWRGAVDPQPLEGGISNFNFVVEDGGERFVARIGGDVPENNLYRARDIAVSRAAHAAGLSPELFHVEADAMVLRWVEGRTLAPADVAQQDYLSAIVELVRQCHRTLPNFLNGRDFSFDGFEACRAYAGALTANGFRLASRVQDLMDAGSSLALAGKGGEPVFCHNDLLAANLIDDGDRLWLIDWEYGGDNNALFDLGNLASNNALDIEAEAFMLDRYYGADLDQDLRRQYAAFRALSLLREAMWSMTAEQHSSLDFDYVAYTGEQLDRFDAAFAAFRAM